MMNKKGLYLHIPFCKKICTYCDFVKRVSNKENIEKYVDALITELELYQKKGFDFSTIETIYIGGGTPSSIDLNLLEKIFKKINELVDINKIKEYNFEINPEDLNNELIELLFTYNISRVSIGIQTLNPVILKFLNRQFDYDKFCEYFHSLKKKISNINFDLMYAIPSQTTNDLEETIEKLKELNPSHFSIYSLILEEKTLMNHLFQKGEISLINEEIELQMYNKIGKLLFPTYKQYEVSNYSLENFESKHNKIYWNNQEYLGIGINSSGYLKDVRYTNTADFKKYLMLLKEQKLPIEDIEELSILDKKKYHIMLGFRLLEGIDIKYYKKIYQTEIFEDFPKLIEFINSGYMYLENDRIKIISKYLYTMNHLLVELI